MSKELLERAKEWAERANPEVRGAALLRIARVETATDRDAARRTFLGALEEVRRIPGRDGQFLMEHARRLAAAVAPDLLPEIPETADVPAHFERETIGRIMLEHGHYEAVFQYVDEWEDPATFPYGVLTMMLPQTQDEARKLALLRKMVAMWRRAPNSHFEMVFRVHSKLLGDDEARTVAREIVDVALREPDTPITASYDQEGKVRITSGREHKLFQILDVLRRLDPDLAERLIAGHPQLAAAAERFPNGIESVAEEARNRARTQPCGPGGGSGFVGSRDDFPYMRVLHQASQDGDFGPAMEFAMETYRRDTSAEERNEAPMEFWPSTGKFRNILYRAGKQRGEDATALLDEIPDTDLRMFARIELAAALAGLPEFQGVTRECRPRGRMRMAKPRGGEPMSGVRCPKCKWVPTTAHFWQCRCGERWNTFQTRGRCPKCQYRWEVTTCFGCRQDSKHEEWYTPE